MTQQKEKFMREIRMPGLFASPGMDSRIKSANVQNSERWLGYFLGPAGVILLNGIMASYLNVFYTDVLRIGSLWGGMFLLLFPILSKVFDALTNIIMGQLIDRTKTRQGKARPWLLMSAPLLLVSGILAYAVPHAGTTVQAVWIIVSYNFYYSIAYTMYYMSHTMMVPLSTRNIKQRDGLAMLSNMALNIIPGMFVAMIFPMVVIPSLGVDQTKWLKMICVFSAAAFPCVILEYFFTKERITEESRNLGGGEEGISVSGQLRACLTDRYWVIIIITQIIIQIVTDIQTTSLIYYCNWVLGTYNDGTTQTIVSAVGNAPLGFGILLMWPLVKRFGKRRVMLSGLVVTVLGTGLFMLNPCSMGPVLGSLIIRAFGALPLTYITMSMLADAMDHVEWKSGFRVDGLTMSIYTIVFTVAAGLAQGLFNLGLNAFGYVPPAADGSWVEQSQAVRNYFIFGYQGLSGLAMIVLFVLFWFFDVEKHLPRIQADIVARHRAEAEAKGVEWFSSEELAEREQEEQDRLAEENRIRELKAKCARKGLDYDTEEAKYQARMAKKASAAKRKGRRK
jgi:glycoside/pentoside/hexuronide:cation symporter, GPH family